MSKENQNLDTLTDAELISLYKDGDETAESILVYRYRGFSFMRAKAMYESYGSKFYLEVDELSSIALCALFVAMEKYDGKMVFYPYWKKIATNHIVKHINDVAAFYKNIMISRDENYLSNESGLEGSFSSGDEMELSALRDQIINYLTSPTSKIKREELDIFLYYLDGYRLQEISELTGLTYHKIRRVVDKIKKKLKILLHY